MSIEGDIVEDLEKGIQDALDAMKKALGKLRTGRANTSILDGVRVDYYGTSTPLAQCATLAVADARMITVQPWDRGLIPEVEKAIQKAGLGLTPQSDGELIRLPIPPLNEERRKDLVKQAKARSEDARISIRNARRDANELLKAAEKDKDISQDELKRALDKVQGVTDKGTGQVEELLASKEKEILDI